MKPGKPVDSQEQNSLSRLSVRVGNKEILSSCMAGQGKNECKGHYDNRKDLFFQFFSRYLPGRVRENNSAHF